MLTYSAITKKPLNLLLHMDTRNKLLLAAILFTALLPPISLAQDTVSVDEMMRRYELYQQGLLKDDSLNADEVVYTSYGKRRYNGRANWKGLPYTYMLVNNLRTPEYPDKEHFWSFVVIRQKLLLGKVSRLRKRYRRATEHGRKPSRRVRRVIESRAPFVLALDSIDGMRREEWESSIPHDYIIKVKSKKMDYAQAVTKDLKMLDDPFQLLGYDVSVHRKAMRIKEGDIVPYDKGTAPSVRDSSGLMETTLTMMDGTGDSRLRRAINNLADTVNSRLRTEKQEMHLVYQTRARQEGESGVLERGTCSRPRLQQVGTSAGVNGRELLSSSVDHRMEDTSRTYHRGRTHERQRMGVQSAGKREEKSESNTSGKQKTLRTKRPSGPERHSGQSREPPYLQQERRLADIMLLKDCRRREACCPTPALL